MEQLLQYVWKHKIFPLKELKTTEGFLIEIIDPGLHNSNSGPDFFNAKIKINGILWVGNVEIHMCTSDWFRHGHNLDNNYNSVILHVASKIDSEIKRADGQIVPQMQLMCPDHIRLHYEELKKADKMPRCHNILKKLSRITVHSWLSALQSERFEQKAEKVENRLNMCAGNWEDAFFITLARNFGFGLNGDAFEQWSALLPFRIIDKYRDNLLVIETFFFGIAGLLKEDLDDSYYRSMQKEYAYLSRVFELKQINPDLWKFLRSRPGNFPHVRIAQLAWLYYNQYGLLSQITEAETIKKVKSILRSRTSEYWETHYLFNKVSPGRSKLTSDSTLDLILINTVVTFLYAYGKHRANEILCERAETFLEELKAEDNFITRMWSSVGLKANNAADSQALLQLKKEYCDQKKCLHCRFGFEYLRNKERI